MKLWDRVFGRVRREPSVQKSKLLPWSLFVRPGEPASWAGQQMEVFAREGFQANSLIYAAIMYKVRAQQAAPLRVFRQVDGAVDEIIESGPLAEMIRRPNERQSWEEFQALQTIFLNLAGNAYAYVDRDTRRMISLRPDWVYHVPGDNLGELAGYLYTPHGLPVAEGTPLLVEDVIHVRFPNPLDPLGGAGPGLSPLAPAAYAADVDNVMSRFLREFFKSGAMPLGILRFDTNLQTRDVDEIRERWREKYGGVMNWLDVGVLDQGGEYQRLGLTFNEMGFESLDERNESRVLGVLGVPAVLLGTRVGLKHATYSNVAELRRVFWEDTFVPELQLFEAEYRHYLAEAGGNEFVGFDYSKVPALQEDVPKQVEAAYRLWTMGYPANDAVAAVGLSLGETEAGALSFIPTGMSVFVDPQAQQAAAATANEVEPEPTAGEGESGAELDEGVRRALEELLRRGAGGKARKEGGRGGAGGNGFRSPFRGDY